MLGIFVYKKLLTMPEAAIFVYFYQFLSKSSCWQARGLSQD
jgi:hypothetical protein